MIKLLILFSLTLLLISLLWYLIKNSTTCIDKIETYQSSLKDNLTKLKETAAKGIKTVKNKISPKIDEVKNKVVDKTNETAIKINDKIADKIGNQEEETNKQYNRETNKQYNKETPKGNNDDECCDKKQKYITDNDLAYLNSYISSSL